MGTSAELCSCSGATSCAHIRGSYTSARNYSFLLRGGNSQALRGVILFER